MGAGQHALDCDQLEGTLDDRGRGQLEGHGLVSPIHGLRGIEEDADDAGVDECGLAEIDDEILPGLERAVDVLTKYRGVPEVKLPFEADGDDLAGLGDDANGSITMVGAE